MSSSCWCLNPPFRLSKFRSMIYSRRLTSPALKWNVYVRRRTRRLPFCKRAWTPQLSSFASFETGTTLVKFMHAWPNHLWWSLIKRMHAQHWTHHWHGYPPADLTWGKDEHGEPSIWSHWWSVCYDPAVGKLLQDWKPVIAQNLLQGGFISTKPAQKQSSMWKISPKLMWDRYLTRLFKTQKRQRKRRNATIVRNPIITLTNAGKNWPKRIRKTLVWISKRHQLKPAFLLRKGGNDLINT